MSFSWPFLQSDPQRQHAQDLVQAALMSGLTPVWQAELHAALAEPEGAVFLDTYLDTLFGDVLTQAQVDEHFGSAAPGFARATAPLPLPAFEQAIEGLVLRLHSTRGPWLGDARLEVVQQALQVALAQEGATPAQLHATQAAFGADQDIPPPVAHRARARLRRG